MQRHATIVSGIATRSDGRLDPTIIVRQARMIDAEIVKQSEAEIS